MRKYKFECVLQMIEQLSWLPLSKRREKQSSHFFIQNYQQFGDDTSFTPRKGGRAYQEEA